MSPPAHVTVGIFCLIISVFLGTLLSDGRSMFTIDRSDSSSLTASLSTLSLGDRYGFGTFHDSNGRNWDDNSNLIKKLGCDDHRHRFNLLKACCIIAIATAGFGVILSLVGAARVGPIFGFASLACNVLLFAMVLIAMAVGWALWSQSFSCDDFSITIKDDFSVNYGPIFLTICFVLALANMALLPAMGAMSSNTVPNEPTAVKDEPAAVKEETTPAAAAGPRHSPRDEPREGPREEQVRREEVEART